MKKIKIYLEMFNRDLEPIMASEGSAGLDLKASENCLILPGETKLISTGIKTAIPKGYEIQIRPRSGISLKTSLRIPNSPGTIDSDYRDEIKIICHNDFQLLDINNKILANPELIEDLKEYSLIDGWTYFKKVFAKNIDAKNIDSSIITRLKNEKIYIDKDQRPFGTVEIKKGDRFAQMVFAQYFIPEFELVNDVTKIGENRGGGFGSTDTVNE